VKKELTGSMPHDNAHSPHLCPHVETERRQGRKRANTRGKDVSRRGGPRSHGALPAARQMERIKEGTTAAGVTIILVKTKECEKASRSR